MNLNQVTIPVSELQRSTIFYEALGLSLIVNAPPDYARFECPSGDATFSLHHVENYTSTGAGAWIYFELENLDYTVTELTSKGFVFETQPEDMPWLWREARLKDPDNHQIILYFAGNNRKNPPWRIT